MQFDKKSDSFSTSWIRSEDNRESAAVLLFFEASKEILVMRRSALVRSHAGQISFPGGRRDQQDQNPLETALRECEEEIGISKNHLEPMGFSNPVQGNDSSWIHVLVAKTNSKVSDLKINAEVERIHMIPWNLLQRSNSQEFSFVIFGSRRTSKFFDTPECRIWGLTAKMIYDANLN